MRHLIFWMNEIQFSFFHLFHIPIQHHLYLCPDLIPQRFRFKHLCVCTIGNHPSFYIKPNVVKSTLEKEDGTPLL